MTLDVDQTAESFGKFISELSDLETEFSLSHPLSSDYIGDERLTSWYSTTLAQNGGDNASYVYELAAKHLTYKYVQEESSNTSSIVLLGTLLDITNALVRLKKVEETLPLLLVEEIFEIQTIGWCQQFWPYLVSRKATLTSKLTGTRAPGTTLIRLCNSLLRRLSKNQNALFSGEIAIFLANAFPYTEKSGLNIRGTFNTENVTFYEGDGTGEQDEDAMDTDDDLLYKKFWSLQKYFSDPVQLTTSPDALSEFKENVSEVLSELKRQESAHNSKRDRENEQRRMDIELEDNEDEDVFVPKWLTRRDLFELQLKDVTFRRSILTQVSIVINFLLSLSEKAKENWSGGKIGANNKSVMFPFTLSPEDVNYFASMQKSFQRTTFTSVDFDPVYLRTINTIMQRDQYWQDWKLKTCPAFGMAPLPSEEITKAQDKLNNTLTKPRRKFWHAMGTAPLTKIWKIKTGLESLKNPEQYTIPDAKTYYDKVVEETERFKEEHTVEVKEEVKDETAKAEETKTEETKPEEGQTEGSKQEDTQKDNEGNEATPVEEKAHTPKATVITKKLVVSEDEQRHFDEQISSKTWRGLRAARSQGSWGKFGLVTKLAGFAGLFETVSVATKSGDANSAASAPTVTGLDSPAIPGTPNTPVLLAAGGNKKRSEPEATTSPPESTASDSSQSEAKRQKIK